MKSDEAVPARCRSCGAIRFHKVTCDFVPFSLSDYDALPVRNSERERAAEPQPEAEKHEFLEYPRGRFPRKQDSINKCWEVVNMLYCGQPREASIHQVEPSQKQVGENQMSNDVELKPCPSCWDCLALQRLDLSGVVAGAELIRCDRCGFQAPAETWNTRAHLATRAGDVADGSDAAILKAAAERLACSDHDQPSHCVDCDLRHKVLRIANTLAARDASRDVGVDRDAIIRECAAKALSFKGGYTLEVDTGKLVEDVDGPWGLGSQFSDAILALATTPVTAQPSFDFAAEAKRLRELCNDDDHTWEFCEGEIEKALRRLATALTTPDTQASAECAGYREMYRWNFEQVGDAIHVCRGDHDKQHDCQWEALTVDGLREALREAQGVRGGEAAAFHRGVDAAKEAIRSEIDSGVESRLSAVWDKSDAEFDAAVAAESQSNGAHFYAALFINAIARKCGFDRPPDLSWLDEIEARANAATPGPWELETDEQYIPAEQKHYLQQWVMTSEGKRLFDADNSDLILLTRDDEGTDYDLTAHGNLEFAAHAREDIPKLIRALREAYGQVSSPESKGTKA